MLVVVGGAVAEWALVENADLSSDHWKVSRCCPQFGFNAEKKLLNRFKNPLGSVSYGPFWLALESMEAFGLLETV